MYRTAIAMTLASLFCLPTAVAAAPTSSPGSLDEQPSATPTTVVVPPLPACRYADVATPLTGYGDWSLTILDTIEAVPASYVPPDLVNTRRAGLNGGYQVRAIAVPDLTAMARAAARAGAPLQVRSAYRSYTTQASTFRKWVRSLGYRKALLTSARPGHSEHQLGLAIDFGARGGRLPWAYRDWAKSTKAGQLMAAHAWQYGFVMSYPRGQTAKSCYEYEPWHYRYVGRAEAAAVHASGLTLREWLWQRQP